MSRNSQTMSSPKEIAQQHQTMTFTLKPLKQTLKLKVHKYHRNTANLHVNNKLNIYCNFMMLGSVKTNSIHRQNSNVNMK